MSDNLQPSTPVNFASLIDSILGPLPSTTVITTRSELSNADIEEAYAHIVTDVSLEDTATVSEDSTNQETSTESTSSGKCIRTIIKDLQPYREKLSKDRSLHFAVGQIPFNREPPSEHDIINYHFWATFPQTNHYVQPKYSS